MLRLIERHRIRVRYIRVPFVLMRVGGRANTIRGIIQGNREIVHAFRGDAVNVDARHVQPFLTHKLSRTVNAATAPLKSSSV